MDLACPSWWRLGSIRAHSSKDQCSRVAVVIFEPLNHRNNLTQNLIVSYAWWGTLTSPPREECTPELRLIYPDGRTCGGSEHGRLTPRRSIIIHLSIALGRTKNCNLSTSRSRGTRIPLVAMMKSSIVLTKIDITQVNTCVVHNWACDN
mgnify:CR=1 FL=1